MAFSLPRGSSLRMCLRRSLLGRGGGSRWASGHSVVATSPLPLFLFVSRLRFRVWPPCPSPTELSLVQPTRTARTPTGMAAATKAAPAGAEKAAVTAKAAMTAVTAATVIAAKAPSASPRTASAPRPLVRRASQEAKNYSCCQNCHVPMALCHCQKSACSICGLSALNCSCKARPSSARPASAPVCKKCAKLDESLSKAQAEHKVLERELAAKRVGHVGHAGHVAWPLPLLTDLCVCVSRRRRRARRCRQR